MSVFDYYLGKQHFFHHHIVEEPHPDLNSIVIIPCFNEQNLFSTLHSLLHCAPTNLPVEIITVINFPEDKEEDSKKMHKKLFLEGQLWSKNSSTSKKKFHFIYAPDLPVKYAGAGLARKIGMDEAVYRFHKTGNENGIILSFDADALCEENYLAEAENFFKKNSKANGCTIYFEHPTEGSDFSDEVYECIAYYELYLRYYIEALRFADYPYAYHTIGSCFAVKASVYAKQGGMNRRKGGEDFYFLQKVIPLGNFFELNSTLVIPSPRPSSRVPFGTGPVISRYLSMTNRNKNIITYNLKAFKDLRNFVLIANRFYKISPKDYFNLISEIPLSIRDFLKTWQFADIIMEVNKNSANLKTFIRRFYHNFNSFMVLKYLNYCHSQYYKYLPLIETAGTLLEEAYHIKMERDTIILLKTMREIQRAKGNDIL